MKKIEKGKKEGLDIFLSVGRISTQRQEDFITALEEFLINEGFNPRIIGRTEFSSQQPLKFIAEVMRECAGTVVIAFERIFIESGVEMRKSQSAQLIKEERLPSIWNQIEAGMAYVLDHPLLVIKEHGLKKEGVLEFGYDWYVQNVTIDPIIIKSDLFIGVFKDWKNRVLKKSLTN